MIDLKGFQGFHRSRKSQLLLVAFIGFYENIDCKIEKEWLDFDLNIGNEPPVGHGE